MPLNVQQKSPNFLTNMAMVTPNKINATRLHLSILLWKQFFISERWFNNWFKHHLNFYTREMYHLQIELQLKGRGNITNVHPHRTEDFNLMFLIIEWKQWFTTTTSCSSHLNYVRLYVCLKLFSGLILHKCDRYSRISEGYM